MGALLMYLIVCTLPDIAQSISCLRQFNFNPKVKHWNCAKIILRYLKETIDFSLDFESDHTNIVGYATYMGALIFWTPNPSQVMY